jgi:competence protein ComEC
VLFLLVLLLASPFGRRPLDINSASTWELESLPGVGPVTAARIVEFREAFGGFTCVEGLLEVSGIGPATLEGLEGLVTAAAVPSDTSHWLPGTAPDSVLLRILFLDVGQGDAILLLPAGGTPCLVDGGPDAGGPLVPPVVHSLREAGVDSVPLVVLTHPHSDHVGGLAEVVRRFDTRLLLDPMIEHVSPLYEGLLETLLETGCSYRRLQAGDSLVLSPEVLLRVSYACGRTAGGDSAGGLSVNDLGAVLLVECGGMSALLTGDIEEEAERLLAPGLPPVSVLKVPHHGSSSSVFGPFLDRCRPQLAVICCGAANPFGHPHPAAVEAYLSRGAEVLRTDRSGTIVVATDGRTLNHHPITGGESGETPQ